MTTWNDRLRIALVGAGLTKGALARASKVSPPTVTDWLNGKIKELKAENAERICRELNINLKWLLYGRGPMRPSDSRPQTTIAEDGVTYGPNLSCRVPLISWTTAGHWGEVVDNFNPGDAEEWVPSPANVGDQSFALRIRGDSMEPTISDGDVVIVDPDADAEHNKIVIVRQNGDSEATCKRLICDGSKTYLRPDNPRYPVMEMREDAVIVGVVKHALTSFD